MINFTILRPFGIISEKFPDKKGPSEIPDKKC